ncbi:MAG: hypothetical protein AAF348_03525 [Bacteroidota bacterium]
MLNKILGILLILISIVIGVFLIPGFLDMMEKLIDLLTTFETHARYEFSHAFFTQLLGWFITYIIFRAGKSFYKDGQKPS